MHFLFIISCVQGTEGMVVDRFPTKGTKPGLGSSKPCNRYSTRGPVSHDLYLKYYWSGAFEGTVRLSPWIEGSRASERTKWRKRSTVYGGFHPNSFICIFWILWWFLTMCQCREIILINSILLIWCDCRSNRNPLGCPLLRKWRNLLIEQATRLNSLFRVILKTAMSPVLAIPDYNKSFVIETYACQTCIGACNRDTGLSHHHNKTILMSFPFIRLVFQVESPNRELIPLLVGVFSS